MNHLKYLKATRKKKKFMQGRIVAWCPDVSAGVIRVAGGKQYLFPETEWRNPQPPAKNMVVAFETYSRQALNVCAA